MPWAVGTSLGIRHIKNWSRGSKPEGPLSFISLRHPMEWYAGSDLCINQQQILTPPPRASSTSPAFPAETLGVLIPAGHVSSESPRGRKTVQQKEETDTFSAVLLRCRKLRDSRSDGRSCRSPSGRFLRDGKPQLALRTRGWGGMQGRDAGSIPSLLWSFYGRSRRRRGSKARLWGVSSLLPQELLRALCRALPASSTSLCLAVRSRTTPGALGEQSLSNTGTWLCVQLLLWCSYSNLLGEKTAIRKTTPNLSSLMYLMSYVRP